MNFSGRHKVGDISLGCLIFKVFVLFPALLADVPIVPDINGGCLYSPGSRPLPGHIPHPMDTQLMIIIRQLSSFICPPIKISSLGPRTHYYLSGY